MDGKGAWIDGDPAYVFENRLGDRNGEVTAVFTDTDTDRPVGATEREIYEDYLESKQHNAMMPDDLKALSQFDMEQDHAARKAIQEYKNHPKVKMPLDTPPVGLENPHAENNAAANDSVYNQNNVADLNLDL